LPLILKKSELELSSRSKKGVAQMLDTVIYMTVSNKTECQESSLKRNKRLNSERILREWLPNSILWRVLDPSSHPAEESENLPKSYNSMGSMEKWFLKATIIQERTVSKRGK
jgi:hypothetical protein